MSRLRKETEKNEGEKFRKPWDYDEKTENLRKCGKKAWKKRKRKKEKLIQKKRKYKTRKERHQKITPFSI